MSVSKLVAVSAVALVFCPFVGLIVKVARAQTYIAPNAQHSPQAPAVQYGQTLQGGTQAVSPLMTPRGELLPAGATFTSDQSIQAADVIPAYPGNHSMNNPSVSNLPNAITLPATPSIQTPAVQVPWSQDLLRDVQRQHDFGSVPTGSQQEHVFEFTNTTGAPLNLISVKASCGCTKPTIVTPLVQPGAIAMVKAKFDTMKFQGEKAATVTVGVNKIGSFTEYGELQFSVKGKIRKDVVLSPGNISFDNVLASESAEQTVQMKYAGNPLWQILRVESTNPNIAAQAHEIKRAGGRITYELVVKLSGDQPAGSFADELYVITNDKNVNKMPISVAGRIKGTLEAAPIKLGTIKQGAKIEKRFLIRGQQPFSIREVRVGNQRLSFALPAGEKTMHVMKYTLDTAEPGEIKETITIVTSDPGQRSGQLEKNVEFSARISAEN